MRSPSPCLVRSRVGRFICKCFPSRRFIPDDHTDYTYVPTKFSYARGTRSFVEKKIIKYNTRSLKKHAKIREPIYVTEYEFSVKHKFCSSFPPPPKSLSLYVCIYTHGSVYIGRELRRCRGFRYCTYYACIINVSLL